MIPARPRLQPLLLSVLLLLAAAFGMLLGGQSGLMLAGFALAVLLTGSLGLVLASGAVSVARRVPRRCDAGQPVEASCSVRLLRPLPWLVLEIRDQGPEALSGRPPAHLRAPALLRRQFDLRWQATPGRGLYILPPVQVVMRDPFGIFQHTLWSVPLEIEVWPQRVALPARALQVRGGPPDEFLGIRPFAAGDRPGRIVWKRYARDGRLLVRRFAERQDGPLEIFLVARDGPSFELVVAAAASVAQAALRAGLPTALRVAGQPDAALAPGVGDAHRARVMGLLARLEPRPTGQPNGPRPPAAVVLEAGKGQSGAALLVHGGRTLAFGSLRELSRGLWRWGAP